MRAKSVCFKKTRKLHLIAALAIMYSCLNAHEPDKSSLISRSVVHLLLLMRLTIVLICLTTVLIFLTIMLIIFLNVVQICLTTGYIGSCARQDEFNHVHLVTSVQ